MTTPDLHIPARTSRTVHAIRNRVGGLAHETLGGVQTSIVELAIAAAAGHVTVDDILDVATAMKLDLDELALCVETMTDGEPVTDGLPGQPGQP